MSDNGCICKGNWRNLVAEYEPVIGNTYQDKSGEKYVFFGLVHDGYDFYYGMSPIKGGSVVLLSCVSDIKGHNFNNIST